MEEWPTDAPPADAQRGVRIRRLVARTGASLLFAGVVLLELAGDPLALEAARKLCGL